MKTIVLVALLASFLAPVAASAGWTNGYYRGPRDGYCWNNKAGC